MLTGPPTPVAGIANQKRGRWAWGPGIALRRGIVCGPRIASGVPGRLFVRILEPLDELLDAEIVGQDLAGHGQLATEDASQRGVEKYHRAAAELAVWTARLEEEDGGYCQAAQLDLAGCLLDEIVALLFRSARQLNQVGNLLAPVWPSGRPFIRGSDMSAAS